MREIFNCVFAFLDKSLSRSAVNFDAASSNCFWLYTTGTFEGVITCTVIRKVSRAIAKRPKRKEHILSFSEKLANTEREFYKIVGTLSIDNETDNDDASQPRQNGPRVSFSGGKTKFKQYNFPDRRRLFLCEELCLVTVLLWHSKTSVICNL